MIEKEPKKNYSSSCKYCGWEFQQDIIQKINKNAGYAICEFCGVEINTTGFNAREEFNNEKYEDTDNFNDDVEKKKGIVRVLNMLTKPRKASVRLILGDDDFPLIFKENFIIVISRLIYIFLKVWEQNANTSLRRVSLKKSILFSISHELKPIMNKRIKVEFLDNLHKLTIEEFEDCLKMLQKKLQSNQNYRIHFKTFLLWLIRLVFRIITDMWNMSNLPKFEATIRKDLKRYPFNYNNNKDSRTAAENRYKTKENKNINIPLFLNSNTKVKIRNFPIKTRLILCKYILEALNHKIHQSKIINNIIMNFANEKTTIYWIKKIPESELSNLREKLKLFEFRIALDIYLQDLVKILIRLNDMNNHPQESLNIKKFAATLIKDKINLGMTLGSLRLKLSQIIDYLNDQIKDFELLRKTKKKLFDDGKEKECAKCHKIKPYEDFVKRKRGKVEFICTKCKLEASSVRMFKNKLSLISEIYEGKFNFKCNECESNISILPALEFHHPIQDFKNISWSKHRHANFNDIIKQLEDEKVLLLCANCHSLRQSKIFTRYREIILKKNLFLNSAEEIHELVLEYVEKVDRDKNGNQRSKIKYNVITWIKKRYIIEQLYQGKCVGCGKIKIMDNLPAYDFHHKNFKLEKANGSIWRRILTKEVTTIIELLIKEECVVLCSNCHRLVHATHFNSNVDNILDGEFSKAAKLNYLNITNNIRKFKFIQTDIVDPLKKKIKYGEIWKEYLILIYQFSLGKKSNIFNSIELVDQFNITQSMINRILSKLNKKGLIRVHSEKKPLRDQQYIIGQIPRTYKFTEVGKNTAKNLIY